VLIPIVLGTISNPVAGINCEVVLILHGKQKTSEQVRLSVSLPPLQQTHVAMSKLVYRLWLGGAGDTLLGVARLAPKECTLTHQLESRSAAWWRQ
jgi:hypothetical protein